MNPTETEWDRDIRCTEYGEVEHCYSLRAAKDPVLRSLALRQACKAHYLDSCDLWYAHELSRDQPWTAFVAAESACKGGEAEFCRIAIHFDERFPKYTQGVSERRPALEARLAELERSGK